MDEATMKLHMVDALNRIAEKLGSIDENLSELTDALLERGEHKGVYIKGDIGCHNDD